MLIYEGLPVSVNRRLQGNTIVVVLDKHDNPVEIQCRLPELVQRFLRGLPCPGVLVLKMRPHLLMTTQHQELVGLADDVRTKSSPPTGHERCSDIDWNAILGDTFASTRSMMLGITGIS